MKKYLLLIVTVFYSFFLSAQEDIVIKGTKKITKEATPKEVVDALNAKFPDANAVVYYKAPSSGVENGWVVTEDDKLSDQDEVDYYTISFKREGLKYYGLYKKDGTLLKSKIEQNNATLPAPVASSLENVAKDHPGYTIKSKTYYKNQNYEKTQEYYEIVAEKGNTVKRLYYQADGKLLKVKG